MDASRCRLSLLVALLLLGAWGSAAQPLVPVRQASVLAAPLVEPPPKLDGKLDDAAWARAQPLRLWAYKDRAVRTQTEGFVCRDARKLYFAARCFDDDLAGLVTDFEGRALWRNDCVELFIVPEKKELFFSHIVVSCDGRIRGATWVPDEWGEPTRGPEPELEAAAGREERAWTMEAAVPIAAFGHPIPPDSVWALGFNREKHSDPPEVSSFQGGFNRPREYPDLVFDGRSIVVDGMGLRNIGAQAQEVEVTLDGLELRLRLEPGQSTPLPWRKLWAQPREGLEFTVKVRKDGAELAAERYVLAAPPKPVEPVDTANIPPARFEEGPLEEPDFFPIGVWLQPAGVAETYARMGVNVYVGGVDSYPRPRDRAFLDAIHKHGHYAICPYKKQYVEEKLHEHPAFLGWMFGDEPDNADRQTGQVKHTPEELLATFARIRRDDPAHRVYLNLGQGVANERFVGRAATDEQYAAYADACDILSFDVYPCNSIRPRGPQRLHLVAKGIARLRTWGGPEKLVWCWIEANKIHKGPGRAPTPEEVKTQVWMALVHGADGYGFFCHSWAGKRLKVSGIEPQMREALAGINAEVHRLAPVLNSPAVPDGATVATGGDGGVDVRVARHDGATYVFAVNMVREPAEATIAVRGVGDGQAEVLFEERTVAVRGGRLSDGFAPYAVHRYRIAR
ncbi:MAG: sugar-binding protein [Candidatus Brocadiia bacterium]